MEREQTEREAEVAASVLSAITVAKEVHNLLTAARMRFDLLDDRTGRDWAVAGQTEARELLGILGEALKLSGGRPEDARAARRRGYRKFG